MGWSGRKLVSNNNDRVICAEIRDDQDQKNTTGEISAEASSEGVTDFRLEVNSAKLPDAETLLNKHTRQVSDTHKIAKGQCHWGASRQVSRGGRARQNRASVYHSPSLPSTRHDTLKQRRLDVPTILGCSSWALTMRDKPSKQNYQPVNLRIRIERHVYDPHPALWGGRLRVHPPPGRT